LNPRQLALTSVRVDQPVPTLQMRHWSSIAEEMIPHHFIAVIRYRKRYSLERVTIVSGTYDFIAYNGAIKFGRRSVFQSVFQKPIRIGHRPMGWVNVNTVISETL